MYKNKKGFTIVELVVVIAVLAILVAVLIPTFANLIRKANLSSDTQLCRILNEDIAMGVTDQKLQEHATFNDVVQYLSPRYTLENLTPTSSGDIVWDQNTNTFSLIENGEFIYVGNTKTEKAYKTSGVNLNLWQVVSSIPTANKQKYSLYLKTNANITNADIVVGFDAGSNLNVQTINYNRTLTSDTDARNVIIRTNGGALTINAPLDTVKHFGDAVSVNVVNVATSSYHEHGEVNFTEISKGRIVLEKDSKVTHIHVNSKLDTNGDSTNTFDTIIIAKDEEVELPSLSRDDVEIANTGTLVVALQEGVEAIDANTDLDYVWLTKQGIYEQIKVSDSAESAGDKWADDASNSADTQNAAQQIANNIGATATVAGTEYNVGVNSDRDIVLTTTNEMTGEEEVAYTITSDNTGATVIKDSNDEEVSEGVANEINSNTVEEVADKEAIETGVVYFAGGTGTENNPFLIVDYDTFQHVSDFYTKGYYNYEVKQGVEIIDCKNWVPVKLNGNFNGNGVVINNLDMGLFDCADGESSTIKNFTINANISRSGGVGAVVYDSNTLNLTIDSVDVHGLIIGANWVTPYVEFGPGPSYAWNLTIKNSISDAKLVATSGSASGFVGHPYDDVSNGSLNGLSLITIIDSAYIGNMSATGNPTATNYYGFKYFTINGNDNRIKTYYSDAFIESLGYNPEGTLYNAPVDKTENAGKANEVTYYVTVNADGSKTFLAGNYGKNVVDHYKVTDKKAKLNTTSQSTLPSNIGDVFTITKVSGATKAVVSLQIAPNDSNNYGSYLGTYMSEEIDISSVSTGATFTSNEVKYFVINVNTDVTTTTGVNGNIFNVVNPYYGKNAYSGATVKIAQFDSNGNVLNITSVQIASAHNAE